jgi:hypothetical protein
LFIMIAVAGVIVGILGLVKTVDGGKTTPYRVVALPATVTTRLTTGSWSIFGRSGPAGPPRFNATIIGPAPSGAQLPIFSATATGAVRHIHQGGASYPAVLSANVPATGTYRVVLSARQPGPVDVIVTTTLGPVTFPWDGLVIDGLFLLLVGVGLTALDIRHARHEDDEEPTPPPVRTLVTAG